MSFPQFLVQINTIILILVFITIFKNLLFLVLNPIYSIIESIRMAKYKDVQYKPMISVIVPAWNEEVGIVRTVESILANDYDNLEVVVVNDGSTDKSDHVMKEFLKRVKDKSKVTYYYQSNRGKGVALNNGIKKSKGDIILTCDADSLLDSSAISNLANYFKDPHIKAVVGNVKVSNSTTLAGQMQQIEYLFSFYNKRAHAVMGAEYIFGGACAAFRKEVFEEIGYFDEDNKTEDIDMSMRTRLAGMKCTYAEDVVCYTEGASRVRDLIKQRTRWKKGRFDTFFKYRSAFFSTDPKHNKLLTWFILPLSMITELQLLLEPVAITLFIFLSYIRNDFVTIGYGILFMFVGYIIYGLFNSEKINLGLIFNFPFTWLAFYLLNWVEYFALINSIKLLLQRKDITWQNWTREGIHN